MKSIQGVDEVYSIDASECFFNMLCLKNKIRKVPDDCIKNIPGVYVFYDWNGEPLRIGKAIKSRNRILQYGDASRCSSFSVAQKMWNELAYVSVIYTGNSKRSSFVELDLLQKKLPKYNVKKNG